MIYYITLILFMTQYVLCNSKKPNFVIFLTDDQDAVLDGMSPMKNVQRFIANEGTTFVNSYVTSPICCPSRASILTGLHVHNHLTINNSIAGGCYGRSWRKFETRTFANSLKNAGYNTFYAGKYLNQYGSQEAGGPEKVPPGWNEWHGLVGNSVYYNYTLSNNGVPTFSTDLYLTDIIRDLGITYIENQTETEPFLMMLAPPAPHQPFTPAPRHRGVFNNTTMPRHPNFNIASLDKHWLIRMPPSPLPEEIIPELEQVYRSRWESLLAVDEMVADIIEALDTKSLLDNTYIIYTSDNGYHIGQFSQVYDKRQPYETDIKVPLVIRGPTVRKNCTDSQPISSIDLAPTIMRLAGLNPPASLDGRPITFEEQEMPDRHLLIEYYGEGRDSTVDPTCPWVYDNRHLAECYPKYDCKCQDSTNNTFGCLRHITDTINIKYCGFADDENFLEMYDLAADPYEMKNIVNLLLPSFRHWYKITLSELLLCKGYRNCDNPLKNPKIYG